MQLNPVKITGLYSGFAVAFNYSGIFPLGRFPAAYQRLANEPRADRNLKPDSRKLFRISTSRLFAMWPRSLRSLLTDHRTPITLERGTSITS